MMSFMLSKRWLRITESKAWRGNIHMLHSKIVDQDMDNVISDVRKIAENDKM